MIVVFELVTLKNFTGLNDKTSTMIFSVLFTFVVVFEEVYLGLKIH